MSSIWSLKILVNTSVIIVSFVFIYYAFIVALSSEPLVDTRPVVLVNMRSKPMNETLSFTEVEKTKPDNLFCHNTRDLVLNCQNVKKIPTNVDLLCFDSNGTHSILSVFCDDVQNTATDFTLHCYSGTTPMYITVHCADVETKPVYITLDSIKPTFKLDYVVVEKATPMKVNLKFVDVVKTSNLTLKMDIIIDKPIKQVQSVIAVGKTTPKEYKLDLIIIKKVTRVIGNYYICTKTNLQFYEAGPAASRVFKFELDFRVITKAQTTEISLCLYFTIVALAIVSLYVFFTLFFCDVCFSDPKNARMLRYLLLDFNVICLLFAVSLFVLIFIAQN